ncbi:PREDICTED: translation initiation factor eIF-2B subunit epsilon [Ceratosolen solmsi marchali]|uniref:Translation initiation factor eIF2B subunit epsilon n=1 Tax=Ceratosolen solmsi marchali TaxID=326594 RepID=A0AAJ6YGZ7_9HYME|nr:PREDICTED: translation initiation factor eIF-2B subunit epsilon [Ceratosolen solmsi marchali]
MSVNVIKELPNNTYGKQESLKVIVFADEFIHDFKPIEKVYPSILLPVVTLPLLDYLIENLIRSRVQTVYLYYSSSLNKAKITDSIKHFQDKNIIIIPIQLNDSGSLGDALRDIDTNGCIRDDFILIRGPVFANIDLRTLMDLHRVRKEKDKNVVLTMVLRNLGNIKDSALKNESTLVVSTANTRRILHYKKLNSNEKKIKLELQWFLDHDNVHINTALFDTRIYVCSQSVLPLFADNFDFQTMEDFIRGVLINEEFLDSRIYWEPLIYPTYALPITSWKAYKILSRDILQRHCYPLVPDTLPLSLRNFIYLPKIIYKHSSSILSKGCTLHSASLVGEHSTLGKNSFIKRSVIGPSCNIGKNVHINNSYLFSYVQIEDNCEVTNSIIFSNCFIEKDLKITDCIILDAIKCSKNHSNALIGISDWDIEHMKEPLSDCDSNFATILTENDHDIDSDEDASLSSSLSSASSSPSLKDSSPPPAFQDDHEMFLSEVIDSLLRGYQDKLKCENLILEINSSRYAYNISIRQVSYNVIKAILNLSLLHYNSISKISLSSNNAEYYKILKTMLNFFKPIIVNYIKTPNAQEDCLRAIEDVASSSQELILPYVLNLLHFFYDNDILFEEKIIEWYEQDCDDIQDTSQDCDSDNEDCLKQESKKNIARAIRNTVAPFIKWLREAEEDSSTSS